MSPDAFIARRHDDWRRLERLVDGGAHAAPDRRTLAALYRVVLADLGQLRTLAARAPGAPPPALAWLNDLVARAHARVALHRRPARTGGVGRFFAADLPRAVRHARLRIGLAAALMLGSALVAYAVSHRDVGIARLLAGRQMARNAESFADFGGGRDELTDSVMAAFYVTNNVQVSFVAFALGVTFGVGTLFVLVKNGILLGVTIVLVRHHGAGANFLGFVSSHSFIELTAIVMAAAAGLGLGHALVAPGAHTRVVALKLAARESVTLVIGAASLLVLAAFFEAFVSSSALSLGAKLAIGALNAAWLSLYLARAGRGAAAPA